MKHSVLFALALAAAVAHAQTPGEDAAGRLPEAEQQAVPGQLQGVDVAAERDRIKTERAAADKKHQDAQKACRAKFAVNDCLDQARREHNVVAQELKRQEHVLNEAERKRKGAAAQKRIDEKNSPEAQRQAEEKRVKALAEQKEREAKATDKAAKHAADEADKEKRVPRPAKSAKGDPAPQGGVRAPQSAASHGPTSQETAKNRAEYEQRQEEAAKHKADVEARNAQRKKPAPADLPPPPRSGS